VFVGASCDASILTGVENETWFILVMAGFRPVTLSYESWGGGLFLSKIIKKTLIKGEDGIWASEISEEKHEGYSPTKDIAY
jgi:hypothetical protein